MRAIDSNATEIARSRHMAGVERLQALFGWDALEAHKLLMAKSAAGSVGRRKRREYAKAQRIARKRNRQ